MPITQQRFMAIIAAADELTQIHRNLLRQIRDGDELAQQLISLREAALQPEVEAILENAAGFIRGLKESLLSGALAHSDLAAQIAVEREHFRKVEHRNNRNAIYKQLKAKGELTPRVTRWDPEYNYKRLTPESAEAARIMRQQQRERTRGAPATIDLLEPNEPDRSHEFTPEQLAAWRSGEKPGADKYETELKAELERRMPATTAPGKDVPGNEAAISTSNLSPAELDKLGPQVGSEEPII